MTLKPTDMLEIQSAIDAYERKFPGRPRPRRRSRWPGAWVNGRRGSASRHGEEKLASTNVEEPEPEFADQECSRLAWVWEQIRLRMQIWSAGKDDDDSEAAADLLPWVRACCWWGGGVYLQWRSLRSFSLEPLLAA